MSEKTTRKRHTDALGVIAVLYPGECRAGTAHCLNQTGDH